MRELSREYYNEFNCLVFENQMPDDLQIEWNSKLQTTAGRCVKKRDRVSIELSEKVLGMRV